MPDGVGNKYFPDPEVPPGGFAGKYIVYFNLHVALSRFQYAVTVTPVPDVGAVVVAPIVGV